MFMTVNNHTSYNVFILAYTYDNQYNLKMAALVYDSNAKSWTRELLHNISNMPHVQGKLDNGTIGASKAYCNGLIYFLTVEYEDDTMQCSLLGFDTKTSLLTNVLWTHMTKWRQCGKPFPFVWLVSYVEKLYIILLDKVHKQSTLVILDLSRANASGKYEVQEIECILTSQLHNILGDTLHGCWSLGHFFEESAPCFSAKLEVCVCLLWTMKQCNSSDL